MVLNEGLVADEGAQPIVINEGEGGGDVAKAGDRQFAVDVALRRRHTRLHLAGKEVEHDHISTHSAE